MASEQKLGNKVAFRRRELGLTINELADRAGVSRITVRHTEQFRENYTPSGSVMLRLAEALETTVQDLFWSEPSVAPEPESVEAVAW